MRLLNDSSWNSWRVPRCRGCEVYFGHSVCNECWWKSVCYDNYTSVSKFLNHSEYVHIDFFPRDHQKRKQKNMDKPPTPTWDLPNCKSLCNIHPSSQANIPRRRKKFWCCALFAMLTWPSSWHLMCHCILDFSIYRWMRGNPRGNRYGVVVIHSACWVGGIAAWFAFDMCMNFV